VNRTDEKEYWEYIWNKFRTGDRRAFETIYNEYVDALFAYGMRLTPHKMLIEDSIQDMFLAVYSHGGSLRKPESLEFYLYKTLKRIIHRKVKEKYRFTHPDQFTEQFDLQFPLENSEPEEWEEHSAMLQKELQSLNTKKRELLFLKFNSGLTYNEIGKLLELKPDTVKKQVLRLLKFLRTKLEEDFF
jgi:RNA polymerase sigma factor (sigma-70 family)